MEERQVGILLTAHAYLGQKKILKVFTRDAGLISLISKSPKLIALTAPFCLAEWLYRKTERELSTLTDGTLLDPFLTLRSSYDLLLAAGSMASDLLKSQLPAKSSPDLYALLLAYFKKLPEFPTPALLATSFRLKLLLHEGLLSLTPECAHCDSPARTLLNGESLCSHHAPGAFPFTDDEWETLLILAHSRNFSSLHTVSLTPALTEKTQALCPS
jgi:DNA repair protein RecO (recombination protein O)